MTYGDSFEEALTYAARLHRAQMRKGTNTPYVTHLLAVAAIVGENGGTEDEVIAALLHDAVEDQGGAATREEIRRRFGDNVARATLYHRDEAAAEGDRLILLLRPSELTGLSPNDVSIFIEEGQHWNTIRTYHYSGSWATLAVVQVKTGAYLVGNRE